VEKGRCSNDIEMLGSTKENPRNGGKLVGRNNFDYQAIV
jgi:hypothetical protein